jgi:16S rRNA (uracil1498-N3)-methyltransferase
MRRFYLADEPQGDFLTLSSAEQLHHLRTVLRLKPGDEVETFDGLGNVYLSRIASVDKDAARLQVISRRSITPPASRTLIGCAVPKNVKMDDIVDKLTQLGVDTIMPLKTERVIANLEANGDVRLARWRKIALSAAEQSGRSFLPEVTDVAGLPDFLKAARAYPIKLIPTLEGKRASLSEVLSRARSQSVAVLIGPEGDFTPAEIELAVQAGFLAVSLGQLVLRVDTAAVAVAAYIHLALN